MFRSFHIIIRELRCSLPKLLHIHDLVRFCKQGVVAAYRYIAVHFPDVGGIVAG